jgi:hypothetical protein
MIDNTSFQDESSAAPTRHRKHKNNLTMNVIVTSIVVLIVATVVFMGLLFFRPSPGFNIDTSKYQAVFLTNGQVYFGKIDALNNDYMRLTDIFYLQTKSTTDSTNPQETADKNSSDVELIKLGGEIHGPEDSMMISRDQVLFYENLKQDGEVSKTITNYLNN